MKLKNIKTKYDGHFKLNVVELINKENKEIKREVILKNSGVGAIVFNTKTEKYIFVKQYRIGVDDYIIEIPAGLLDVDDEEPENCMKREIEEETGYKTDSIVKLVDEFYSSPGFSNEKITLYYAEVSEKINNRIGVGDEEIEIIEMDYTDLTHNLISFKDAKTILALYKYLLMKK